VHGTVVTGEELTLGPLARTLPAENDQPRRHYFRNPS
jgi:hypothetical protein